MKLLGRGERAFRHFIGVKFGMDGTLKVCLEDLDFLSCLTNDKDSVNVPYVQFLGFVKVGLR